MSGPLAGRTCVVTGAGGGLGPAVVTRLARDGARVLAVDLEAGRLEASLAGTGAEAHAIDLLDEDAVRALADGPAREASAVLHLVGGWKGHERIALVPTADWAWLEALLVRTTLNVARAFADALGARPDGRLAIVSAAQAQRPTAGNAVYAAAKAAAEALVLAVADEFRTAQAGATANVVVVNALLTPAMRAANPERPFRTFTPVEDVADALAWLVSDAAGRMNGQRLSLVP